MSYELFVQQLDEVEKSYPKLKRKLTSERYILSGQLDIIDANGKLWDNYQVKVHYEDGFPFRFPALYETGNKIPKIGDWHIYEDTLACCVTLKPAAIITCLKGMSVLEYIKD